VELKLGALYFKLTFAGDDLLVPTLMPVVFAGRNRKPDDDGIVYFQDYESYRKGIRYVNAGSDNRATFERFSESDCSCVFEYEDALDELQRCFLRRTTADLSTA
jgi:hypothetical protein